MQWFGLGPVLSSTFGIDLAIFYFCYFSKMTVNIIKKIKTRQWKSLILLSFSSLLVNVEANTMPSQHPLLPHFLLSPRTHFSSELPSIMSDGERRIIMKKWVWIRVQHRLLLVTLSSCAHHLNPWLTDTWQYTNLRLFHCSVMRFIN